MTWRTIIRSVAEIAWSFIAWGGLFAVPHALLWSGHYWWAAFAASASVLILEYEYHGSVGFAMLPGMLSIWLLASSGIVYAGSIALLLRGYGLNAIHIIPSVCVAVVLGGYVLVKADPWLGRLYSRRHPKPSSSQSQ
jgi:hypothetical protein